MCLLTSDPEGNSAGIESQGEEVEVKELVEAAEMDTCHLGKNYGCALEAFKMGACTNLVELLWVLRF